ncbi:hypothetical protein F3Y22_tig00116951pilonHSYRG00528 [Hibiscus syriacus]|uniref:Integrase catalytic domain-containing protein n=1 Tax=Hibiscus syriacus TaxID=106335 RepID=A0A6A2X0D5_HIBSY|nr:hypothetical protein F3Y22_tig00116951pilonHSYRG00528 [Hibiscus syriacus]
MRLNLISAGKLDDAAKLYKEEVNITTEDVEIWHKRLGHISEKCLHMLARKQLLPDVKGKPLDPCAHCLARKHIVAFQRSSPPTRRKNILDLDQVLDAFKEFHALVERETRRKINCVRSDNEGEYRGPFKAYCKKYGIRLERTPPKTPQLNELVERMNRTIEERVRCVLSHDKLTKSFWGEAIMAVVDIVNLKLSVPLNLGIPEEVRTGKRASCNHLKVFGCRSFVHIPKDERAKLDIKKKEYIYLHSPKDDFGYRFWDPVNKKVFRSRDVVFFEHQTIKDIKNSERPRLRSNKNIEPTPIRLEDNNTQEKNDAEDHEPVLEQSNQKTHDEPAQEEPQFSSPTTPEPRQSSRDRRPSTWYNTDEYIMLIDEGEPQSYKEAMSDNHKEE